MSADWYRVQGDDLLLRLRIQPRASREGIDGIHGDRLRIRVSSPPVDDAANTRLIELLAETLKVPRAALSLVRGARGREKDVLVRGGAARHLELASRLVAGDS